MIFFSLLQGIILLIGVISAEKDGVGRSIKPGQINFSQAEKKINEYNIKPDKINLKENLDIPESYKDKTSGEKFQEYIIKHYRINDPIDNRIDVTSGDENHNYLTGYLVDPLYYSNSDGINLERERRDADPQTRGSPRGYISPPSARRVFDNAFSRAPLYPLNGLNQNSLLLRNLERQQPHSLRPLLLDSRGFTNNDYQTDIRGLLTSNRYLNDLSYDYRGNLPTRSLLDLHDQGLIRDRYNPYENIYNIDLLNRANLHAYNNPYFSKQLHQQDYPLINPSSLLNRPLITTPLPHLTGFRHSTPGSLLNIGHTTPNPLLNLGRSNPLSLTALPSNVSPTHHHVTTISPDLGIGSHGLTITPHSYRKADYHDYKQSKLKNIHGKEYEDYKKLDYVENYEKEHEYHDDHDYEYKAKKPTTFNRVGTRIHGAGK